MMNKRQLVFNSSFIILHSSFQGFYDVRPDHHSKSGARRHRAVGCVRDDCAAAQGDAACAPDFAVLSCDVAAVARVLLEHQNAQATRSVVERLWAVEFACTVE